MGVTVNVSDLEKHFVKLADQGASIDKMFSDFAAIINAKFIKFKYRNPDSYGVLLDENEGVWVNLFYSPQKQTFGFQALNIDGTLQAVLPLQHSDSSIVDVILRLTANIGNFSTDYDSGADSDGDSGSYSDESSD